jgi:hypothetical protein
MAQDATVVFTAKSTDRILREGGTSAWRLDRNHARQRPYVICTRNAKADWVEGEEAHRSAFLVGRVRDVVPCEPTPENEEAPKHRFLIQFSEFARISLPEVWSKGDRNPVKYGSLEDFAIDPSHLNWEQMPPVTDKEEHPAVVGAGTVGPLSIAEAKRGLALAFNVAPSSVEITIRG